MQILSVVCARPNLMKIEPIIRAMKKENFTHEVLKKKRRFWEFPV